MTKLSLRKLDWGVLTFGEYLWHAPKNVWIQIITGVIILDVLKDAIIKNVWIQVISGVINLDVLKNEII